MSVKRHSIILFLTLLVPWAGYGSVSAQTGTDDLRQSRSIYQNAASNQAALYSGSVEEPYKYFFHGTPYLETDEFTPGDLFYDGSLYHNVRLRLNTHQDILSVQTPSRTLSVMLHQDNVGYAVIKGQRYHVATPKEREQGLGKGYIITLHEGRFPLHWKNVKYRESNIVNRQIEYNFTSKDTYYLEKDGLFWTVSSKGSILKHFKEHKRELNSFIKQNNLKFGKDERKESLIRLLEYAETLF